MIEKNETNIISENEKKRRKKVSKIFKKYHEKKRKEGYKKWLKELRKKKKEKEKERLKEKKKKEKERLKQIKLRNKRPVGRPKKRGPKKKRKKKAEILPKQTATFNYKLISCHNGKQNGHIGQYNDLETAYIAINNLLKISDDVIFPREITTSHCIKQSSKNEYLLLEKNGDLKKDNPLIRNEYGKLIEHRLNSEKWVILDKFKYNVEETFWVYGYHPNTERKTFKWIYDNILINNMLSEGEIVRVLLYKNKVIFRNDNKIEMVLCKNQSEAIRFYNILEEKVNNEKYNNIFFIGSYSKVSDMRRKLEDELILMTGWDKYKIQKSTTTKSKNK